MADDQKTTDQLKRIIELLQGGQQLIDVIIGQNAKIIELLTPPPDDDITNLGGSISTPVKKQPLTVQGEREMAIKSVGPTNLSQNMFDDQTATYTPAPTNAQGVAEAFPTGTAPSYSAAPGTAVTLVPATDGSGSLVINGVPGQAGVEVITGTYTNPDGTVCPPVTLTFTQSVDPAEADIQNLGGAISTPVAQTQSAKSKRP